MELPPDEAQYEAAHISDDDSTTLITAVATCFFITFVAVTLRLLSRRLKHQALLQDDFAAIIALAFIAGISANIGIDLRANLGKHIILSDDTTTFAKAITSTDILYMTALIPTKFSIIFYYRRLSTSASLCIVLWLLGIWVVITSIAGDLLVAFNCAQLPTVNIGAHCVDYKAAILSYGAQDVLMNLVLLCWPIQFLWGLEMDRIRVAHLVGVFALGGFACAASIIRLIYQSNASLIDPTWSATAPTIWSIVELAIGLTAGCLATLTPLITLVLPDYRPSSSFPTTACRTTRSFISDAETAIATPQPSSRKRTRTISFKDPPLPPQSRPSTAPSIKSWRNRKTGTDSPSFTWRCSGRPTDLAKWKALPLPPTPALPEMVHVLTPPSAGGAATMADGVGTPENAGAEFGPDPLFRPVVYGRKS